MATKTIWQRLTSKLQNPFSVRVEALPGGRIQNVQEEVIENIPALKPKGIDDRVNISDLPTTRVSVSDDYDPSLPTLITSMTSRYQIINAGLLKQVIPLIRGLAYVNPDVSQALDNIVSLGNTGHKIFFDRKVPTDQVDEMRNHLINKRKDWASGQAGMDGVVNRMFSQLCIAGALSNEWVPESNLKGIESLIFVDPEHIEFALDSRKTKYEPYQRPKNLTGVPRALGKEQGLIKLNPNTYRYYALNGDGEFPNGIPPYLPIVPRIRSQHRMYENIDFIVDTMGLIGFLEVLITKPMQTGPLAKDAAYRAELQRLMTEAKDRILEGVKNGVVVGFKDDHEFNFNSATKSVDGVTNLFQENELQIFSGLKQDAALAGRGYATSETQIGVVFMKMLSQLRNIQNVVKTNLEFGYSLELRLAGFNFNYLTVQFNRSTIQDDLKYQQSEEIKIRNTTHKYVMGVIDLDQAADELGYETPAGEPLVDPEVLLGVSPKAEPATTTPAGAKKATKRKDQKGKAAKGTRKKNKPTSTK